MPASLLLTDTDTARDVLTFAGRAARAGADAVRLQAEHGVLRVTAATLSPNGLLDATPTVLAMRVVGADPELVCDFAVVPDGLTADALTPGAVTLPDTAVSPAWTGVAPPQSGWEALGEIPASVLQLIAADGIAAVADTVPTDAGEDIVRAVRARVWGPLDERVLDAPRGVAFTADAFGFLRGDETVAVFRAERWMRFSLRRGHVLSRGPARVGLTPVRATGAV
ncbi:hypothetical protein [Microbacterium gorillae]|uniref:hypothetical protein n=1 Tax=Microbacterium gorillae TaxID=1231063 RepID=UPI00058EC081|nr:hypothetical protein [Microbacterium gorillae]